VAFAGSEDAELSWPSFEELLFPTIPPVLPSKDFGNQTLWTKLQAFPLRQGRSNNTLGLNRARVVLEISGMS